MSGKKNSDRRDLDLMMKSYRALEAEQNDPSPEPFEREPVGIRSADRPKLPAAAQAAEGDEEDEGDVVMYRGRPVRRGISASSGAGSSQGKPTESRDRNGKSAKGVSIDKIKQALGTLAEMHEEGLITKAEFNKKRRQLLDRL